MTLDVTDWATFKKGGTPDKEFPCNWITVTGGPMCIGDSGEIVLGPDHLKGQNVKDVMARETHGRISEKELKARRRHNKSAQKRLATEKEMGLASMPPRTATSLRKSKRVLDGAVRTLNKLGHTKTVRNIKSMLNDMVVVSSEAFIKTNDKLNDPDGFLVNIAKEVGGTVAGAFAVVAKLVLPHLVPHEVTSIPQGLGQMVPVVRAYGALPAVAIAIAATKVCKKLGLTKLPKSNKRQRKLAGRAEVRKETEKLKAKLKNLPRVHLSDDSLSAVEFAGVNPVVRKAIEKALRREFKHVARHYNRLLRDRAREIKSGNAKFDGDGDVGSNVRDSGDGKRYLSRYKCPGCGGTNAYNGIPGTGTTFRGGGYCENGCKFSIVGLKLKPIGRGPEIIPTPEQLESRRKWDEWEKRFGRNGTEAAFSGEGGTPDKEHPCNWITLHGGPMCVGEGGTIVLGPKHLQGRNAKDVMSAEHHGRIDAAAAHHKKAEPAAEKPPAEHPVEHDIKQLGLSEHHAASVRRAHATLDKAHEILGKAGEKGKAGVKTLHTAANFLVSSATVAMIHASHVANTIDHKIEHTVAHRYGPKGSAFIEAAKEVIPDQLMELPEGFDKFVPGVELVLGVLPAIAGLEVMKQLRGLFGSGKTKVNGPPAATGAAESDGVKSKKQQRLLERSQIKKTNDSLHSRVRKEVGITPGKHLKVDVPAKFSGDVKSVIRDAMAGVMKKYARWLSRRQPEIAKSLKPLDGGDFPPKVKPGGDGTAKFERDYVRTATGEFAPLAESAASVPTVPQPNVEARIVAAAGHTVEAGTSQMRKAMDTLKKAASAATDVPGIKQLKQLSAVAKKLVAKASDRIAARYGKRAGSGIMLGGALIANNPFVAPLWLLVMPGGTLLGALPFIAVAESVHQAKKVGRAIGKVVGFDAEVGVPESDVHEAMLGVWNEYLEYVQTHKAEIEDALMPLQGVSFSLSEGSVFSDYSRHLVDQVALLSRALADGSMSLASWRGEMFATLSPSPLRAAFAANPYRVSQAAWDLAETQSRAMFTHLVSFADRLENLEEDWESSAPARADLYARTAPANLEEHFRLVAKESGAEEERRCAGKDCCDECRAHEAKDWQPVGELPACGDCDCATKCQCKFQFAVPVHAIPTPHPMPFLAAGD